MSERIYHIYGPTNGACKGDSYCGNPSGGFMHIHFWLKEGSPSAGFCQACLESEEIGLDLLASNTFIQHHGFTACGGDVRVK